MYLWKMENATIAKTNIGSLSALNRCVSYLWVNEFGIRCFYSSSQQCIIETRWWFYCQQRECGGFSLPACELISMWGRVIPTIWNFSFFLFQQLADPGRLRHLRLQRKPFLNQRRTYATVWCVCYVKLVGSRFLRDVLFQYNLWCCTFTISNSVFFYHII